MNTDLNQIYTAILGGDLKLAVDTTRAAVEEGVSPNDIINGYMIKAMEEIGARFEAGKAFVPNLLMSARAMKGAMEVLKPLMKGESDAYIGKVVIGTVQGDLHNIGKNLVASMLEGCGFEIINLGVDIPCERFLSVAREEKADIICLSALLTTTMERMKEIIDAVHSSDLNGKVKVMVGGAPISREYAESIHADAYSDNANGAVAVAKALVNAR